MRESAAKILPTHEVTNQPPPLPSVNLFEGDIALVEAVRRSGAEDAAAHLKKLGHSLPATSACRTLHGSPTAISRSCVRSTGSAIARMRSNFIRPITS